VILVVLITTFMHIKDKLPPLPHCAVSKYSINCLFNLKRKMPIFLNSWDSFDRPAVTLAKMAATNTVNNQDGQPCPKNPMRIACGLAPAQKLFQQGRCHLELEWKDELMNLSIVDKRK